MTQLNITNGDSAVDLLRLAGVPGEILPWRDVLHEGPINADLSLDKQSCQRARYISAQGWGNEAEIHRSFINRDETLKNFSNFSRVVLWFEHDLYDQLQILQILNWFNTQDRSALLLELFCTEKYLGYLTPGELGGLFHRIEPVHFATLAEAADYWSCLCQEDPLAWAGKLSKQSYQLIFMRDAVLRLCQEYPRLENGLSRTMHQALSLLLDGPQHPGRLFGQYMETEQRRFMGDASFFRNLNRLLDNRSPLLHYTGEQKMSPPFESSAQLSLTELGKSVVAGELHWLLFETVDEWIGGVHLRPGHYWVWNDQAGRMQPYHPK